VLAFGIWLIDNLSQSNTDIVGVPVVALSNIDGHAERSSDDATITARCRATGFQLMRLTSSKDQIKTIEFDPVDFQHKEGDFYTISASKLGRYTSEIFGQGVTVEQFLVDDATFRFAVESNKRLPVRAVEILNFRPQYTKTEALKLNPDSITVYGSPDMIERLTEVYTAPLTLNEIRNNMHGELRLEKPAGLRLSDNTVDYSLNVSRYVAITREMKIEAINVPEGVTFSVFPSTARVSLKCIFPLLADPVEGLTCTVDYNDFENSRSGVCLVKCQNFPQGVLECKVTPEVAECMEIEDPA